MTLNWKPLFSNFFSICDVIESKLDSCQYAKSQRCRLDKVPVEQQGALEELTRHENAETPRLAAALPWRPLSLTGDGEFRGYGWEEKAIPGDALE